MDMEQLNKSQLVLLTLLVSFMTSIATGIVTVALMQQAPLAITETVNRVVERTVERVVTGQAAAAATPTQTTVVVKEAEQISQSVDKIAPSVVRLYTNSASSSVFLGIGIVMDSAGTIAADASSLGETTDILVEIAGSMRVMGKVSGHNDETGIVYLAAATTTQDGRTLVWKSAQLASSHVMLGQTVVVIGGKSVARIGQGIITAVSPMVGSVKTAVQVLETNISKDAILPGSPIMDTGGAILGISTGVSRATSESGFITSASVLQVKDKTPTGP